MSTFNDREKGFENKFKHDQEATFKATARRNKLLGLWVAKELGLSGAAAEDYAKSVVVADMEKPGDDDVVVDDGSGPDDGSDPSDGQPQELQPEAPDNPTSDGSTNAAW